MKRKIGKTVLPVLLSLMLLAGLVPTVVFAAPNADTPVAQIDDTPYDTLNDAFKAAAEMDTYNGEAVSKDNPVTIEILRDFTLDETIWVKDSSSPYPPVDWHVKLTSANGENYTITRDPEKATDYMIQMKRPDSTVEGQYDSSLILENVTLDGGATKESKETDTILLAYGWIELNDGAVLRNNKCNNSGGAINLQPGGKLILNDGCLIENNTTTNSGGGIYVWGECVMNGGTIRNNQTLGKYTYGGGVCVDSGASFTMNGGTITQNITYYNGGGLYFDNSGQGNNVFLYGGSITGNQYCSSLTGNTSSDDVYGQFAGTTLVIGGEIEIGDLVFSNAASKIIVDSPLTHAIHIDYSIGMKKDLVVVEKGENYGDGDLDRSKFIFPTSWIDYCFWLTEDGSAIKVDNHDGGTDTCTKGAECSNCGKVYGQATGHTKTHYEAKKPTILSTGNIEYWYCPDCDTCFADEALTTPIDPASVILAQLPKPLATEYYLNFAVEEHGSVTPGSGMYAIGSRQTFTIRPDSGYVVDAVLVDGKEVSVHNNQFTLTVDAPYRITVRFAEAATAGTPSIDVGGSGSTTTATPNPQTGDNSPLAVAILLLGGALLLTAGLLRRQTKANR